MADGSFSLSRAQQVGSYLFGEIVPDQPLCKVVCPFSKPCSEVSSSANGAFPLFWHQSQHVTRLPCLHLQGCRGRPDLRAGAVRGGAGHSTKRGLTPGNQTACLMFGIAPC